MRMQGARRFQTGGANFAPTQNPPFSPQQLAAIQQQQMMGAGMPPGGAAPGSSFMAGAPANSPWAGMPMPPPGGAPGAGGAAMAPPPAMMNQMRSAGPPPPAMGAPPPAPPPGGAGTGPFVAGAPANGLGAAPGLNAQAIQQALAARRGIGGGPPMQGPPGGAPGRGWPGMPQAGSSFQGMPPGAGPSSFQGMPPGAGPSSFQGLPPGAGRVPGMADGGSVGRLPQFKTKASKDIPSGMADGGPVKRFRKFKTQAAEDVPEPEKKAKGGVLKKRPKGPRMAKASIPPPPPPYLDQDGDQLPPPAIGGASPVPGPSGPPPPVGPGMKKGGKWIEAAIKHPGALRKELGAKKGENIPAGKLAKAAEKGGKLGARARMAEKLKSFKKNKGGKCDKMAAGGAAKQRKGYPNTIAPPKKFAEGGKIRGCGAATKGCRFQGIF